MADRDILLIVSERMNSSKVGGYKEEDSHVRVPKRVREKLGLTEDLVEITGPAKSHFLTVKQAYTADIRKAKSLADKGMITLKEKRIAAFVTSGMFKSITKVVDRDYSLAKIFITEERLRDKVLRDKVKKVIKPIPFLIGTDPEFALVDESTGAMVHAEHAFGAIYEHEELGGDSLGQQVELRPKPSRNHKDLVTRMTRALEKDPKVGKIKDYIWQATSYKSFGHGGHVHIGGLGKLKEKQVDKAFYVATTRILDELVGVPHSRIEGEGGIKRRKHTRFGHHGDFRQDLDRLEWRTPGGDWMAHPNLAKAFLGTVMAVTEEILTKIASEKFNEDFIIPPVYKGGEWDVYKTHLNRGSRIHFMEPQDGGWNRPGPYRSKEIVNWGRFPIVEVFNLGDLSSLKVEGRLADCSCSDEHLKAVKKTLRKMSTYKKYKADIERFLKVCGRKDFGNLRRDMRETWLENKSMFK